MTDQTDEEPLMSFRPKNDFERLLWARNEIRELKTQLDQKNKSYEAQLTEKENKIQELDDRIALLHELSPMTSKAIRNQNINLKTEKNKLKAKYDDLLYKYTIVQQKNNLLDFK